MSRAVSTTEVSRHFSEYLNRVAYKGEHFVLSRGKKMLAELRPVPRGRCLGELIDLLRSLPHLSQPEADAFLKDLSRMRLKLAKGKVRDPWAS